MLIHHPFDPGVIQDKGYYPQHKHTRMCTHTHTRMLLLCPAKPLTGEQRGESEISILIVLLWVVFYPLTGIRVFSPLVVGTAVNSSLCCLLHLEERMWVFLLCVSVCRCLCGGGGCEQDGVPRWCVRCFLHVTFTLQGMATFVYLSYQQLFCILQVSECVHVAMHILVRVRVCVCVSKGWEVTVGNEIRNVKARGICA